MSNSSFGSGSGSYGQFWFGGSSFPGFLYKRNLGVGGRRSTKMTPGGNITCNQPTDLYNKYKPGQGGVGASSTSNRRAKNRLATVCSGQQCFPCYPTLGQYSNYTGNPNGFIPCPYIPPTPNLPTSNPPTSNPPTSNIPIYIYPPFSTTGGSTVTYTDSTYVITFKTNGTMAFLENAIMPTTVNYLFVGGGGGGGFNVVSGRAGGGGAGGQVLYATNVFGSTPTTTLTFTVAVEPPLVIGATGPANGNPTICSGPGITTITAQGGLKGGNSTTDVPGIGGIGSGGGGNGGNGGNNLPQIQGTAGSAGSSYVINGTKFWFGGGGAGGSNGNGGSPRGGRGGGGGSGSILAGNATVNPYTGPNGISQSGSKAGYINSGGGGAGANAFNNSPNGNQAGSSGIVVVWFSYP